MAFNLAPVIKQKYLDSNGNPLAGGKLYTYQSGTSTLQATYTDSTGVTPNSNPVILDSNGEANVWLDVSLSYKFILKDSSDNTQWTVDNVIGLITNNSVTTAALQDLAVTTPKIADDAVSSAKLQDDASVDANRAVTTNHIRDNAVTNNKLDLTTTTSSDEIRNLGITASVATNALTIALKTKSGTDPSATDYVNLSFRDSSATVGTYNVRKISSALSIVIPASTTIGTVNAAAEYIYIYAIDNAGTVELAVSLSNTFDQGSIVSTSTLAGGSTRSAMYSTTARASVPARLIGRILITEATAGTWASSPSEVAIFPFNLGKLVSCKYYSTAGAAVGTSAGDITYSTREIDSHSAFSGGTTFTVPANGKYSVSAKFKIASVTLPTNNGITISILKNGSIADSFVLLGNGSSASPYSIGTSTQLNLVAGDLIKVQGNIGVGASMSTNSYENYISILGFI